MLLVILGLSILSCLEKPTSKEFDYNEAVTDLQGEIQKMQDGDFKSHLLWKTHKILAQDTLYKHELGHNEYDNLKDSLIWNDYFNHPLRQLNLIDLRKVQIQDSIEAYKFNYYRSFSPEIVQITISKQINGLVLLKSQVYWNDRDCNPIVGSKKVDGSCFKVKLNVNREIDETNWQQFIALVNKENYWNLVGDLNNSDVIFDGSDWTVEGTKTLEDNSGDKYQTYKKVYRLSPEENSALYKLGRYLLNQSEYAWGEIY
ncbi:MAG: hypothetical protein IPL46_00170 [Saprospiraceae bacterium]|nr:hypothetical protein [Saprospiraceae bacterium]